MDAKSYKPFPKIVALFALGNIYAGATVSLFLDITGWSKDVLGEQICNGVPILGSMDITVLLAEALLEFHADPDGAWKRICELVDEDANQ